MVLDLAADRSVFPLRIPGYCPICEQSTAFEASGPWYRDTLSCPSCRSVVRERAVAMVLNDLRPDWRELAIHEAAPLDRGISPKLRSEAPRYVATQYYPHAPFGTMVNGVRNENLEAQTFGDGSFDIVITLDVMEHVFHPEWVYAEVFRTLKDGGAYIHTFPIRRDQMESHRRRAELLPDGNLRHHEEPQYHGNPVDLTGSLVTFDYGYDIQRQVAEWAPFDVSVTRYWDRTHGIIGEFTEVIVCRRPGPRPGEGPDTPRPRRHA